MPGSWVEGYEDEPARCRAVARGVAARPLGGVDGSRTLRRRHLQRLLVGVSLRLGRRAPLGGYAVDRGVRRVRGGWGLAGGEAPRQPCRLDHGDDRANRGAVPCGRLLRRLRDDHPWPPRRAGRYWGVGSELVLVLAPRAHLRLPAYALPGWPPSFPPVAPAGRAAGDRGPRSGRPRGAHGHPHGPERRLQDR